MAILLNVDFFWNKKTFYQTEFAPLYTSCIDYNGFLMEDVTSNFYKKYNGKCKLRFKRNAHLGGIEGSDNRRDYTDLFVTFQRAKS